jgi:hypothetical protein
VAGLPVYLEVAPKRSFAGAVEWPGWSRSGRTEEQALEALAGHARRFARVVGNPPEIAGGLKPVDLEVVERVEGSHGTEFGVPGRAPSADERPIDRAELDRFLRILEGSWRAFDAAAEAAVGRELRTGPRGGGRSLDKIIGHVFEAEIAYLTQLGQRFKPDQAAPLEKRVAAVRREVVAALSARALGQEVSNPNKVTKKWLPRYFVRRVAWHVLDHAWELEDRVL